VTALVYVGPAGTGFTLSYLTITGSLANLPSATRFSAVYVRSSSATLDHVTAASIFPGTGFDGNQQGVSFYVRPDPASSANVTMSWQQGTGNSWTATHCSTHASSSPLGIC
jgi:hypothetical protein